MPTGDGWQPVPDAEPNSRSVKFECCWNGMQVMATATAHRDQIAFRPNGHDTLEVPLQVWHGITRFLTVAALMERKDP